MTSSAGGIAIPELAMDLDSIIAAEGKSSTSTSSFKRNSRGLARRNLRRSRLANSSTAKANGKGSANANSIGNGRSSASLSSSKKLSAATAFSGTGKRHSNSSSSTSLNARRYGSSSLVARPRSLPVKVSIYNITYSVKDDDLIEIFSKHCNILRAQVFYTAEGRSTGSGLLYFPTIEEAKKALEKYKGITLDGREMHLELNANVNPATLGSIGSGQSIASRLGTIGNGRNKSQLQKNTTTINNTKTSMRALPRKSGGVLRRGIKGRGGARKPGTAGPRTLSDLDVDLDSYMSQRATGSATSLGAEPMQVD